jgi:hypothetical protein
LEEVEIDIDNENDKYNEEFSGSENGKIKEY